MNNAWAIANDGLDKAMALVSGKLPDTQRYVSARAPRCMNKETGRPMMYLQEAAAMPKAALQGGQANRVAVIPVDGVLTKYGSWFGIGTVELLAWLDMAEADPTVAAVVLDTCSPGGMVWGIDALAKRVASFSKPVVAFVDGMAASGAYWLDSQCDAIVIEDDLVASVGSIGAIMTQWYIYEAWKQLGFDLQVVRSPGSPDKATPNSLEPFTQEQRAQVEAELQAIKDSFDAAVLAGRDGKVSVESGVLTGKMYTADEAIANGLADQKGTLGDAMALAMELAMKKQTGAGAKALAPTKEPMEGDKKGAVAEATLEDVQTQLQAAEARATQAEQAVAEANGKVEAVTKERDALEERAKTAEAALEQERTARAKAEEDVKQLQAWKDGQDVPEKGAGAEKQSGGNSAVLDMPWNKNALEKQQKQS